MLGKPASPELQRRVANIYGKVATHQPVNRQVASLNKSLGQNKKKLNAKLTQFKETLQKAKMELMEANELSDEGEKLKQDIFETATRARAPEDGDEL